MISHWERKEKEVFASACSQGEGANWDTPDFEKKEKKGGGKKKTKTKKKKKKKTPRGWTSLFL